MGSIFTKHSDIRYNLTREQVKNNIITMEHLQTKYMTLAGTPFLHLRPLLLGAANHVSKAIYLAIKRISTKF